MGKVFRCYAEKKPGFDVEARRLRDELRQELDVTGLEEVRVLHRYDVEGIDEATSFILLVRMVDRDNT